MSDYDPNRLDPNRPDPNRLEPNRSDPRDAPRGTSPGFNWSWVIGGIAAIVVLLVAMSFMNDRQRSAEGVAPSQQTTGQSSPSGQASPPATSPAEKLSPRPASPNQ